VYFFNLTNPEEVFNGVDLPRLVEVGPYTYKQQWLKQNVTWHNNGTISYRTRKIFTFVESESCDGCSDVLDNMSISKIFVNFKDFQEADCYCHPIPVVSSSETILQL